MASLISGLGGAAGFGESSLVRADDSSFGPISLSPIFESGLNFFGKNYTRLWINTNGSVTFNGTLGTHTGAFVVANGNPQIAPYFADIDTTGTTNLVATPGGTSTGSNRVYYDFDTANDRFIVTWDDVGFFSQRTDLLNAFQLVLTDRGGGDFDIEFRYEAINWTTGNASGGSNGLGGIVARAGYVDGTGLGGSFFELPASGNQDAMLALDATEGNTGLSGQWLFSFRAPSIFSQDADLIDFNALQAGQVQLIKDGARVTDAMDGNDVVTLPNLGNFAAGGVTFWTLGTRFDSGGGNDSIRGGTANDAMFGNLGNDTLRGGSGNDVLRGGLGADLLVGGTTLDGSANSPVKADNGIDVALYEKSRSSYRVESEGGHWKITDLGNGDVDDLFNVDYLIFGAQSDMTWTQAEARIAAYNADPGANRNVYRLPYLYLDFDNPIPFDFKVVTDAAGTKYVARFAGSDALGVFADEQKTEIVSSVQDIFDRSGVELTVVAGAPPAGDMGTTIRFSSENLTHSRGRLLGRAYQGVDRFNTNQDDDVAVWMDGDDNQTTLFLAAAHEAGHAFGLRHLNPLVGTTTEVMDYQPGPNEAFTNNVGFIVEPPTDKSTNFQASSHNSLYHLLRYTIGQTESRLAAQDIEGGIWDVGLFNRILQVIQFPNLSQQLSSVSVQIIEQADLVDGADPDDDGARTFEIGQNVQGGAQLSFALNEGDTFRILGSTGDPTFQNVTVEFTTPGGPRTVLSASQSQSLSGTVMQQDSPQGPITALGTAALAVTSVTAVAPLAVASPVAVNDAANVNEDASVTINALANDTHVDVGAVLTISAVADPPHGTATIQLDSTIKYTPDQNFNGQDTFTYTLDDGLGSTATGSVTVTVTGLNDTPDAADDNARINFNAPVTIPVLLNDSDVDGNALLVTAASDPANGTTVVNAGGTITYTPDSGYRGTDSFTYTISDGQGGSDTATVAMAAAIVPRAQTILTVGQAFGVLGFPGFITDVFITGTAGGAEVITIGDFTNASFSNNFARGGDTIRLTGPATNFDIGLSGNQVSLVSAVDQTAINLPVGFDTITIVFETTPFNFSDSRSLRFVSDGVDADALPDLFLGTQRIMPDVPPVDALAFA